MQSYYEAINFTTYNNGNVFVNRYILKWKFNLDVNISGFLYQKESRGDHKILLSCAFQSTTNTDLSDYIIFLTC